MRVFVTVGTTKFEQLVNKMLSESTLRLLRSLSCTHLVMQVGNGVHEAPQLAPLATMPRGASVKFSVKEGLLVEAYTYKSTIGADMVEADLVVSHAGSGSIIESLEARKKLIVVVNETLMDNHQLELAEKMFAEGYLLYTTCATLDAKLELAASHEFSFNVYTRGNPHLFGRHLNKLILVDK